MTPTPTGTVAQSTTGGGAWSAEGAGTRSRATADARLASRRERSMGVALIAAARSTGEIGLPARQRGNAARVATGPCKQNIRLGADVDITTLPLPLLHAGDGGRYLNT